MAAYYLEMEPALFKSAIEDQFQRIKDEINKQEVEEQKPVAEDSMDLTISGLNNRVQQMRDSERRATVRSDYVSRTFILSSTLSSPVSRTRPSLWSAWLTCWLTCLQCAITPLSS